MLMLAPCHKVMDGLNFHSRACDMETIPQVVPAVSVFSSEREFASYLNIELLAVLTRLHTCISNSPTACKPGGSWFIGISRANSSSLPTIAAHACAQACAAI